MEYSFNHIVDNLDELNKYKGKPLVLLFENDDIWFCKVKDYTNNTMEDLDIYDFMPYRFSKQYFDTKELKRVGWKPIKNTFDSPYRVGYVKVIRTMTKEEFNIYRTFCMVSDYNHSFSRNIYI